MLRSEQYEKQNLKPNNWVINKKQIKSITQLSNGNFNIDYDGSMGLIQEIDNVVYGIGIPSIIVNYNGKIEREYWHELIVVNNYIKEQID